MPKVGVLLSGCGVQDGSEIYESVLTILALDKAGATWLAMAPDVEQAHVVNHYTGEEERLHKRHALTEAARIVRGKITSVSEISAHDIDALIIPGGFGVVKNLCTFAADGIEAKCEPERSPLDSRFARFGQTYWRPLHRTGFGRVGIARQQSQSYHWRRCQHFVWQLIVLMRIITLPAWTKFLWTKPTTSFRLPLLCWQTARAKPSRASPN